MTCRCPRPPFLHFRKSGPRARESYPGSRKSGARSRKWRAWGEACHPPSPRRPHRRARVSKGRHCLPVSRICAPMNRPKPPRSGIPEVVLKLSGSATSLVNRANFMREHPTFSLANRTITEIIEKRWRWTRLFGTMVFRESCHRSRKFEKIDGGCVRGGRKRGSFNALFLQCGANLASPITHLPVLFRSV